MADYPQKFYKDLVEKHLKESTSGEFFFRFYIYECVWNKRKCDQPDDFEEYNKIKFDVYYDFDK